MKQKIVSLILALVFLSSLWGIIYTHSIFSPSPVSAHESLNELKIPLGAPPVAQNDSYGVNKNSTLTVSASGVLANDFDADGDPLTAQQASNPSNGTATLNPDGSFTYTPHHNFSGTDSFKYNASDGTGTSQAEVTIYVRSVFFREDTNEITKGECVDFTWLVRGDIDRIEFEIFDDNKNPYLVSQPSGDRKECPVKDTRYQLIVRWLDGTSDKDSKIDIKVEESEGGGGGGGSTGGEVVVEGTIAPVGPFYLVTPILITNAPGIAPVATPVPVAGSIAVPKPTGVLESVNALPETGAWPSSGATPVPKPIINWPEASNSITAQPHSDGPWLTPAFRMGLLLGITLVGLTLLVKFLRQSD